MHGMGWAPSSAALSESVATRGTTTFAITRWGELRALRVPPVDRRRPGVLLSSLLLLSRCGD